MALSSANLQTLAFEKIADSRLLLENGRWSSAYYIAGYAAEFALKATIAKRFIAEVIPEKSLVLQVYTHRLNNLLATARLDLELQRQPVAFRAKWALVAEWSEESRYGIVDELVAQNLLAALDGEDGVFEWLKTFW